MLIHVGIYPRDGELSYYNETEKKIVNIDITEVWVSEIEKVNLMFQKIKTEIKEEFGFLCIFLDFCYGNEIRKKFIEEGLKIGFKSVELINQETVRFLHAILQNKYKPLNGDIIWIDRYGDFNVWKINDQKANFIGLWIWEFNEIHEIVDQSKLEKGPDIVFSWGSTDETNIRNISADCKFVDVNSDDYFYSNASLFKARLSFGDSDLFHLDIRQFLSDGITLKIGNKEIESFIIGQKLPINYSQKLKKESKNDVLKIETVVTDVIELPEEETVTINFAIDINEIYSVDFIPSTGD